MFQFYKIMVEGKEYIVSGTTVARILAWPNGRGNAAAMIECSPEEAARVLATPRPSRSRGAVSLVQ